ncbi:MAG: P-loop NTPase fold protein [Dysgonomonas sp.]|uniref:KAP family P-loop NTPase fold protein n=1 Tax=Dysgonomonas sp. TaxID=1891233 RepID=UPI0039E4BB7E
MDKEYIADSPVLIEKDDRFQRYNFARRIAETIIKRKQGEGIVIGIYGAWGEGKTSVINFIDTELSSQEDIIRIKFNPWRYSDENSLLYSFFCKMAEELGENLLNLREKIGRFLQKHSEVISCDLPKIGDMSKAIGSIGNLLGGTELEELKNRLEEIILKSGKKVIIFIDDIDRLDKNEIHSVFRLVKLTANFSNSIYILAFDENVVSSAIGERYATNDSNSGRNFLDKIIQVPLNIPKAQPEALQDYCFQIINEILRNDKFDLTKEEGQRFGMNFSTTLLQCFDTPRMIVRYGNSLSFALPLLNGEVNLADLMLIEGVKIAYPNLYEYIKENYNYFIEEYKNILGKEDNDKKELVKKKIETLIINYEKKEQDRIIELLCELFPILQSIYKNMAFSNRQYENWYKDKRISSPYYFKRFFSYTVIKGELSDISFNSFVSNLSTLSLIEIRENIKQLITTSSAKSFIYKIRIFEKDFSWEDSKKISLALSKLSKIFPDEKDQFSFLDSQTPKGQLAIFIYRLIWNHKSEKDQLSFVKKLVHEIDNIEFVFDFIRWLQPNEDKENDNIFKKEELIQIWKELNNRVLKETKCGDIFDDFPEVSYKICKYWENYDKVGFRKYIKKVTNDNPQKIIQILRNYLPLYSSLGSNKTREGDLEQKTYQYLTNILDKEFIMKLLLKLYTKRKLNKEDAMWNGDKKEKLEDFELASQFYHWYKLDSSKTGEINI